MTDVVKTTTATVYRAVYRTERHASVDLWLSQPTWHDRPRRREQNRTLIVRNRKSKAELVLDVLYYWSSWQTRSVSASCSQISTCRCRCNRIIDGRVRPRVVCLIPPRSRRRDSMFAFSLIQRDSDASNDRLWPDHTRSGGGWGRFHAYVHFLSRSHVRKRE